MQPNVHEVQKKNPKNGDICITDLGFPGGWVVMNLPANAEDTGLISGSCRYLEEGNGNPLQYSCTENPVDRGA